MSNVTPLKDDDQVEVNDSSEMRAEIAGVGATIRRLRGERKAINEEITAELTSLKAKGIPKAALKRALDDCELDEADLGRFDFAYDLCRRALGKPVQEELFVEAPVAASAAEN